MTGLKFVVGGTLVTAGYNHDHDAWYVSHDGEEWTASDEQIVEHYEPVSEMAESHYDQAVSRVGSDD